MNTILLIDTLHGAAAGILEIGANWLLQSTLLIVFGLLVGAALRRKGAAVQSAVYRVTFVAALAAPLATGMLTIVGFSGWAIQLQPNPGLPAETVAAAHWDTQTTVSGAASPESTISVAASEPNARGNPPLSSAPDRGAFSVFELIAVIACMLWAAVSSWFLFRLGRAGFRLKRLRRNAATAEPQSISLLHCLADALHMNPPELRRTPLIGSPCLSGIRRPVILLPEEPMPLPLREVLVHELAHLRRCDCLWQWFSQIALAVFFLQPFLWLLVRRMEAAAEAVCDDYVVESGADPCAYARRLADVAERSLSPVSLAALGIVPIRSLLQARIRRLLDPQGVRTTRPSRTARAILLGSGVTGALLAGFVGAADGRGEGVPISESATPYEAEGTAAESSLDEARPNSRYLEQIELRSIASVPGGYLFSLHDPENDHTFWIEVGETRHGIEAAEFEPDRNLLTLRYEGAIGTVSLSASRISSRKVDAAIANEVAMAKKKLEEMRDSYGDEHPDVRAQIEAIESLQRSARTPGETLELARAREQLARLRINLTDEHPQVQMQLRAIESLEKSAMANDLPDLAAAKAELAGLRVRYTDQHPAVQSQLEKVAALQRNGRGAGRVR